MAKYSDEDLLMLRNLGKSTLEDLHLLNIHSVDALAKKDPSKLFHELKKKSSRRIYRCMWDKLAAIIHEAKTGEATDWWEWTEKRKKLEKEGKFSP